MAVKEAVDNSLDACDEASILPEILIEIKKLSEEIPFYEIRHLIKPGIAGWAQLHNPNAGPTFKETMEKLQYDLYYLKNRSAFLDLSIILKTIRILLSGAGK